MFDDLVSLFSGWYADYVSSIRNLLETTQIISNIYIDANGDAVTNTVTNDLVPEIWSAFVPWEQIIAVFFLAVFTICAFKLLRTVLCKVL